MKTVSGIDAEQPDPPTIEVGAVRPGGTAAIRVVRVIARLNVGGPARQATVLGEMLEGHGFESLLVHGSVGSAEGSFEGQLATLGVRAVKIPDLGRRIRPWSDLHALYQLTRLMFQEHPDIVHTHTAKAGTLGRLAAFVYNLSRRRTRRCAVIHTFHGHVFSGYFGVIGTAAVRWIERGLASITDRVIAISASQKSDICERYRVAPARKTDVIELGIELEPLLSLGTNTVLREELGFGSSDVVFGYVGRFVAIKNLPALLRAFGIVAARVATARLMLVGDGELRGALQGLVADLGLGARVVFTGWRHDLATVYGAIDVGVISSLNEGTPMALIEAMAAGRPVIATAVGGVTDVVSAGRSGLVVPAGDVERLAEAMIQLAGDPAERGRLGSTGRNEIASRFGTGRLVTEISQLYLRALAGKRGPSRLTV